MRQRNRYMSVEERRAEAMARDPVQRQAQARGAAKRRDEEKRLLAEYHAEDTAASPEHAALNGA